MPVDLILQHPKAIALPASGYGMLVRLIHHFWVTDCRALPERDIELFTIARAQRPVWAQYHVTIKEILADVLPEIERQFLWRQTKLGQLSVLAQKGATVKRARALEKKALDVNPIHMPEASRPSEHVRRREGEAKAAKAAAFTARPTDKGFAD